MFLSLLFFPLFGAIYAGFFSKFGGSRGAAFFSVLSIILCFSASVVCFSKVSLEGASFSFSLFSWVSSGLFSVRWGFLFDSLTVTILIVVTTISLFVHIYSVAYIEFDPHLSRFISYLSFFTFFILILVSADNFLQIFLGWEGVGLCSYLLINFWFTRIQANKAAIKAMLVNRVGDFGLALGIFGLFYEVGSLDYYTVFSVAALLSENGLSVLGFFDLKYLDIIAFFLFVGSIGKSAQVGLHTWLPDAIEGPTPVSALIHAATIVTAGVFLLARCSPIFEFAPNVLWFICFLGGTTAFFAASVGLFQNDLKKVVAYSTCSQLGYIVFACGLSAYNIGVFHLANHAFFKALLFLTAGSLIHSLNDEQDLRRIGRLGIFLPYTYMLITAGSLALAGFPFLSGFYSKEILLEIAFAQKTTIGFFTYILGTSAAFITAFYSMRSLHLAFLSNPRGFKKTFENLHEAPFLIGLPLFLLTVGSVLFGFCFKDLAAGYGSSFYEISLFSHPVNFFWGDAEFLPLSVKLTPLVFSFGGLFLGFLLYSYFLGFFLDVKLSSLGRVFYTFFNKKWFFDRFFNDHLSRVFLELSYRYPYKLIDKGVFEVLGPFGLGFFAYQRSLNITKIHSGHIYHYSFTLFIGFLGFLLAFFIVLYSFFFDSRLLIIIVSWFLVNLSFPLFQ